MLRLRSDGWPDLRAHGTNLGPTSDRPRSSSHAGLTDLTDLSSLARTAVKLSSTTTHNKKGRAGWSGWSQLGIARLSGRPTSDRPRARSVCGVFHGNPCRSAWAVGLAGLLGETASAQAVWFRGSSAAAPIAGNSGRDFSLVNRRELRLSGAVSVNSRGGAR